MLKFLSSMLCTSKIHPFSLGNYLGTSCIIENLIMNETGLYFKAHPNRTPTQGKVKGRKLQKEHVTLTLVVNSTRIDKLELLVVYASKQPQCFGRSHLVSMFGGIQIKQLG